MINNYVSMHVLVQSIPIFIMCTFMGLVARVESMSVASSSLVGGLGTLHQTTHRETKSVAQGPPSLFIEPQEKNRLNVPLLYYHIQSPYNYSLLLANGHTIT